MENISESLERSVDEVVLIIHSVLAEIVYRATNSKSHSFKSNKACYPCGSHVRKESHFAPKALSDNFGGAAPENVILTIRVNLLQLTLKSFRSFFIYFLPYCKFVILVK